MVQTAIETVQDSQLQLIKVADISVVAQRQVPIEQTIHKTFRDSSCDTVTRRSTFMLSRRKLCSR